MKNMTVDFLDANNSIKFPPLEQAKESGLLAFGGDLSPQRLIAAYKEGIFPWYGEGAPIMWWSPDPRCVLIPEELKISRSLKREINRNEYEITFNKAFEDVIHCCAHIVRMGQNGTWLQPEMIEAYTKLHRMGVAISVEAWYNGELAGGLYGLYIDNVFFGESMFHLRSHASKIAFIHMVKTLEKQGLKLVDCQQTTNHMLRLGAKEIARAEFIQKIK